MRDWTVVAYAVRKMQIGVLNVLMGFTKLV